MRNSLTILVSNQPIPSKRIGSWTNRITKLLVHKQEVFDFVLSPSNELPNSFFCKKRKFITWNKHLRKYNLLYWVAQDYIQVIKKLSSKNSNITIVIIDDKHLLEAMILAKKRFKCAIEIVFSFHGYRLDLETIYLQQIDKVLFLSQKGLDISKSNNNNYPESYVVGNGVDSNLFFPLEKENYITKRKEYGFNPDDEILIWAANDRPKKGLLVFYKIIEQLLELIPQLKVIIIGSLKTYEHPNVLNAGRISNQEVALYFQMSNYYMFTTLYEEGFGLSLIEAYKCGNAVITSNKGAIPEVISGLEYAYSIEDIQRINSWITNFEKARKDTNFGKIRIRKEKANMIWSFEKWEQKFIDAIS